MEEYAATVTGDDAGKRLDVFLMDFARRKRLGLSRTLIQRLIEEGSVTSSHAAVLKPHHKVREKEIITLRVAASGPLLPLPETIPLTIVYDDAALAVIDKPAGLVVHPAPGNPAHTLVNALLQRFGQLSTVNPERPGIVHRLDKDTSGLLVVAKDNLAHRELARQFAEHSIKRTYTALVKGRVEFDESTIEIPIGRHPQKRKRMSVGYRDGAKFARTFYRTLERHDTFSLLELSPFTGRTHQLRVHLAFAGHPVLGDPVYGNKNDFPRLALHARSLGFVHPVSGAFVEFTSPLPDEFTQFLSAQRVTKKS